MITNDISSAGWILIIGLAAASIAVSPWFLVVLLFMYLVTFILG